MLMVILGAGASYDAIPTCPPDKFTMEQRLPLADELFDDRFRGHMQTFPRCLDIVPRLHRPRPPITVERALEVLRDEAAGDPVRISQLAAIRFYLQDMLWTCETNWQAVAQGMTNHRTLIDQIRHWSKPGETVCFVTFNYDRVLESALWHFGLRFETFPDYVAQDAFKVVKLHGSVNWAREIDSDSIVSRVPNFNQLQHPHAANALADRASDLRVTDRYEMLRYYAAGQYEGRAVFPAIAIPVQNKDTFECPPYHVEELRTFIRERLTKVLIIGWRGDELPFRLLLAEHPKERPISVMVVDPRADDTLANLQVAELSGPHYDVRRGFTDFIRDPAIGNKFLQEA
jgi:UDP-2,3-diacylglucosamine pyrophosphatase LpxH